MGGGDLNAKKSWHPLRATNLSSVAKAEADAIAERKKTQARLEEIKEDIKREEIQRAIEARGGKAKPFDAKLAWMYSGPTDGRGADSTESEAYLLGKRRIDKLLQDTEIKKLQKQTSEDSAAPVSAIGNVRDAAAKVRDDPLLAMKKVEQQAYEALMNDPIKRRQLLASMGLDDADAKRSKKEDGNHKHRHHHRHHRYRDDDGHGESRSRRHRRSDSGERSRSPKRYDSGEDERRRRRRDDEERDGGRRTHHISRRNDLRDQSSRRGRDSYHEERDRDDRDGRNGNSRRRSRDREHSKSRFHGTGREDDERARKLAAMQEAATDLDRDRDRRLSAMAQAERAAQEADELARERDKKYGGGDRQFASHLHRQAGEAKLDRINRGRQAAHVEG